MTNAENDKKLKKVSKKGLKTMQKNRNRHIIREKARVVKYGTKGLVAIFGCLQPLLM